MDIGARSPEVVERVLVWEGTGDYPSKVPSSAKALDELIPSLARRGFGFQNLSPDSVTEPVPGQ